MIIARDENNDYDYDLFEEGYEVSNNKVKKLGPFKYEDAVFVSDEGN